MKGRRYEGFEVEAFQWDGWAGGWFPENLEECVAVEARRRR